MIPTPLRLLLRRWLRGSVVPTVARTVSARCAVVARSPCSRVVLVLTVMVPGWHSPRVVPAITRTHAHPRVSHTVYVALGDSLSDADDPQIYPTLLAQRLHLRP